MNNCLAAATLRETAEQLATRHFDALNATSLETWFVDSRSRSRYIRLYAAFIQSEGAARFEALALSQEQPVSNWSNNVAFGRLLQRQAGSLRSVVGRLASLPWITYFGPDVLLQKAALCRRPEWVEAKAAHFDAMPIGDADKAALFCHELDAAIGGQALVRHTG